MIAGIAILVAGREGKVDKIKNRDFRTWETGLAD